MIGTNDSRRAQLWRNEAKAKQLLDQHGEGALAVAREAARDAGLNLRVRWHWRRIEQHLHALQNQNGILR